MDGYFDGQEIKIVMGATGRNERFEFYYGGFGLPDGMGHGHVVSNDGVNIHYWRKPHSEGGQVVIDDRLSFEQLSSHGIY
jgi:hypothetical protein